MTRVTGTSLASLQRAPLQTAPLQTAAVQTAAARMAVRRTAARRTAKRRTAAQHRSGRTRCLAAALLAGAAFLLISCGANDEEDQTPPPSARVTLVVVAPHTVRASITGLGTVEPAADAAQEIAVPYEAMVRRVLATRGMHVAAGQPLLELVANAGAHVAPEQARRDADLAGAEQARVQRLHAQGLATNNELRSATNAAANASEQLAAVAPGRTPAGVQVVLAARAGVLDALTAQQGTIVSPGASLGRITQSAALIARLGFEPEDVAHLDTLVGERTIIITTLRAPDLRITARLAGIDGRIDGESRLVNAVVQLPAGSRLLTGEGVRGELITATHVDALCVPRAAVLYDGADPYVFVAAQDKGHAVALRRDIKTGLSDDVYIEVTHGLTARDTVITTGNHELANGMAIRTAAAPRP